MTGQELEHRQEATLGLSPIAFGEMVKGAQEKAKILQDIVEQAHLYANIGGKKYLDVQAWQTIGRAYGYTARTSGVVGIEETAITPAGVMARCEVYDTQGTLIGGAEGWCMRDEEQWKDRPFYALSGMAQTRAISRAFRQLLSWVVVLAGYAPTPAEEMIGTERPLPSQPQGDICAIHNIPFFQAGKMREPAHKLPDGSWCNKSQVVVKPSGELVIPVQPIPSDAATRFFAAAKEANLDGAAALAKLQAKDWHAWIAMGGTLETALARLHSAGAR